MRDGTSTKRRIQQEATRLFVEKGVDAVSMRDIASAVGIRASALYVHWASREALVADLFMTGYAAYGRRLAEAVRPDDSFADNFTALIRLVCAFHAEDETLFRFLLLNQHMHLSDIGADLANPVDTLSQFLSQAAASGDIPPGDAELRTAAIIGIVTQPEIFRIYGRIQRGYPQMADEIVALCRAIVGV